MLRPSSLFACLIIFLSIVVMTGNYCVAEECGVRAYLKELKAERDKLVVSRNKLMKGIALLNSTVTASSVDNSQGNVSLPILNTRIKQLAVLDKTVGSLEAEILVIDTRCANTVGVDCDACAVGYTNYPKCDVAVCSGVPATSSAVCSGKGSCIAPNTCNCTSQYYGNNCQNSTCVSFPSLIHRYSFANNDGRDAFGTNLNPYVRAAYSPIAYSTTDVPPGVATSAFFNSGNGFSSLDSTVKIGSGYTLSMWMKKNNQNTGIVFSLESTYLEFRTSTAFSVYVNNNVNLGSAGDIFTTNDWHHIALVFQSNAVQVYADGVLSKTLSGSIPDATGYFVLGCLRNNCHDNYFWEGSLANVLVFNSALTAPEVNSVYNAVSFC